MIFSERRKRARRGLPTSTGRHSLLLFVCPLPEKYEVVLPSCSYSLLCGSADKDRKQRRNGGESGSKPSSRAGSHAASRAASAASQQVTPRLVDAAAATATLMEDWGFAEPHSGKPTAPESERAPSRDLQDPAEPVSVGRIRPKSGSRHKSVSLT